MEVERQMVVKKIMSPILEKIRGTTPIDEAASVMKRLGVKELAVIDHGQITGILTEEDIVHKSTAKGIDPTKIPVGEIMTVGEITCLENQTPQEVAQIMTQMNKRHLIVLNQNNQAVGIVSYDDISKYSDNPPDTEA